MYPKIFGMMQVGKSLFVSMSNIPLQIDLGVYHVGIRITMVNKHVRLYLSSSKPLTLEVLRYGKVPLFFFEMAPGLLSCFHPTKQSANLWHDVYMWNSCAKRCCLGLDSVVSSRDAKKSPGTNLTRHEEGSGVNGAPVFVGIL